MILLVVLCRALGKPWGIIALVLLMAVVAFPKFCCGKSKARTANDHGGCEAGNGQAETSSSDHSLVS
jgi:hypothetical protein